MSYFINPQVRARQNLEEFTMQTQVLTFNPVNTNDTLLDQLESQGVELNSQCRDGYCGGCRVKLLEGDVQYQNEPLAALQEGEILPCSCKPATQIKISIK